VWLLAPPQVHAVGTEQTAELVQCLLEIGNQVQEVNGDDGVKAGVRERQANCISLHEGMERVLAMGRQPVQLGGAEVNSDQSHVSLQERTRDAPRTGSHLQESA